MSTPAPALKKSKKKDAVKKRLSKNLFEYCRKVSFTACFGTYNELISLFKVDLETQKLILVHKILLPEMEKYEKLGFMDKATIDSLPETDLLYVVIKTCKTKDLNKIVKFLIQKTVEIFGPERLDKLSHEGAAALHAATHFGNVEMVRDLIEAGASINIKAAEGCSTGITGHSDATPLIMACCKVVNEGLLDIVRVLCEVPAIDIDAQDSVRHTALQYAARNGHADIIKLLYEKKANLFCGNRMGTTPLMYAAAFGQQKAIEEFLKIPVIKDNINRKNSLDRTALHYIFMPTEEVDTLPAREVKKQTVLGESLKKMGADPILFEKQSTLSSIARQKTLIGQMLLKVGSDPTALDNQGMNGIILSITSANTLLVIAFLNYLAKLPKPQQQEILNHRNEFGGSALISAVRNGDLEIVKLVVKACKRAEANLNITNFVGHAALHFSATEHCSLETMRFLLDEGVAVNVQNEDGNTPASIAASLGQVDKLKLLCERGADVNIPNLFGVTPLLLAITFNQISTVKYLTENTKAKLTGLFKSKLSKEAIECVKREYLLPSEQLENEKEIQGFLRKNMKIYKTLIDRGLFEKENICLLLEAIKHGSAPILELLLLGAKKLGQSEKQKFLRGAEKEIPLLEAAYYGNTQMVAALIKAGANLSHTDEMGRNFLMMLVYGFKNIDKLSDEADIKHVGKSAVVTCQCCAEKNLTPMMNPVKRLKSVLSLKHSKEGVLSLLLELNPIMVNYLFQSKDKQGNTAIQYAINLVCDEAVSTFWQYNASLFQTEHLISFLDPNFKAKFLEDRYLKGRYETLLMTMLWNKTLIPFMQHCPETEDDKLMNAHCFFGNFLALNHDRLLCDESGTLIFAIQQGRNYVAAKIADKDIFGIVSAIEKLGDPVGPIMSIEKALEKKVLKILLNYVPEIAQKTAPKSKEQLLQAAVQAEVEKMVLALSNEYKSLKEWIQKLKQEFSKLLEMTTKSLNLSIDHIESGIYYAREEDRHKKVQHIANNNTFKKELELLQARIFGENGGATDVALKKLDIENILIAADLKKEVIFKSLSREIALETKPETKKEKEMLVGMIDASKKGLSALKEELTGYKNSLQKIKEKLEQQLERQESDYRSAKSREKSAAKAKSQADKRKKKKIKQKQAKTGVGVVPIERDPASHYDLNTHNTHIASGSESESSIPAKQALISKQVGTLDPTGIQKLGSEATRTPHSFRSGPTELRGEPSSLSPALSSEETGKFDAEQDLRAFIAKHKPIISAPNFIPERLSHYEQERRQEGPVTLTLDSLTEASANSFVMDQKIQVNELLAIKTPTDELAFLKNLALIAASGQLLEKLKEVSQGLLTPVIARHIRNVIFHGKVAMDFKSLSTMLTRLMEALSNKKAPMKPGSSLIDFLNAIDPPSTEESAVKSGKTAEFGLLAKLACTDLKELDTTPEYYEQELMLAMQHLERCKQIYLKEKNCNLKLLRTAIGSLFAQIGSTIARLQNILKVSDKTSGDLQQKARGVLFQFMETHAKKDSGGLLEGFSLKTIRSIGNKVRHANTFKPKYGRDFSKITPWQEDVNIFIARQFAASLKKHTELLAKPSEPLVPSKKLTMKTELSLVSKDNKGLNPETSIFAPLYLTTSESQKQGEKQDGSMAATIRPANGEALPSSDVIDPDQIKPKDLGAMRKFY